MNPSQPTPDSGGHSTGGETLDVLGENALVARLVAGLHRRRDVSEGPGDDCAVVVPPGAAVELVLTSDPVIDGIHFDERATPGAIGHKAVGRVLSDMAAMGASPLWALVDIVAPPNTPASYLAQIYRGANRLAAWADLAMVGGDVSSGSPLSLHVFGCGQVPCGRAVKRSGGRPGDLLAVTGSLGGSAAGHHLTFTPRLREGCWLRDWATAMMDISDGLATDLPRLCERSQVGARLQLGDLPLSDAARQIDDDRHPLDHALADGEDFELLFALPPERKNAFISAWNQAFDLPCTFIGVLTDVETEIQGFMPDGSTRDLGSGYEHFRR